MGSVVKPEGFSKPWWSTRRVVHRVALFTGHATGLQWRPVDGHNLRRLPAESASRSQRFEHLERTCASVGWAAVQIQWEVCASSASIGAIGMVVAAFG